MPRILPVGALALIYLAASCALHAQTPDTHGEKREDARLDNAVAEITLLKRIVADQDRRIATLERTVRSLQTTVVTTAAAARPVPPAARSRTAAQWAAIKIGMSNAEVANLLGEPQSTDSVIDRKTLFYKDASDTIGTVTLIDDRVSEVNAPRFQIFTTGDK